MKHELLIVLAGLMPSVGLAQQQITITNTDMPNVDDTFRFSICDNLLGIVDLGDDGPDQSWNYSTLGSFNQRVDGYVDPVFGTPLIYNVTFSNIFDMNHFATLAAPNMLSQFGGNILNVTEVYDFYRETNNYFSNVGLGLTINGLPLTAKMEPRDMIYEFPLQFGDEDQSFGQFGVEVPNFGYYGQKITRNNTVDAWGEIQTRYGTFDALRVTTILNIVDTLSLQGFGFEQPQPAQFEVKWLAKNVGVPVLTAKGQIVFGNYIINSIEYLDSIRGFTQSTFPPEPIDTTGNGIADIKTIRKVVIAPNPASDELNVQIEAMENVRFTLSLWDVAGRCISESLTSQSQLSAGSNRILISLQGLPKGLYQLNITTENGQRQTVRFVKV